MMRLNFPSEAAISNLPKDAQEKYKFVRAAKAKLDALTAHRQGIEQAIKDNASAAIATAAELKLLLPKWSVYDNIKSHLKSEAEQRKLERGY